MGLESIDLNLLVALDALLTERSVTKAAERLSVGQPAMSATLSRLRRHFDDPLLVRQGRALVLTPRAASLVEPVRQAMCAVDTALGRGGAFDPGRSSRGFTIMASDYVLLILLRRLIEVVEQEAPGVQIYVEPITPGYEDQLRRGQADLLILPAESAGRRFSFPGEPLFSDRYVLAVDRENPEIGDTVDLAELAGLNYAAYTAGPMIPVVEGELDQAGIDRRIVVSTQSFVVVPFLLRDTRMAAFLHERLAKAVAEAARLRVLEPPLPIQRIHEVLYWNPRSTNDPAHSWLRGRIVELARELDE